jgi:hypothetical protein
MKTNNGTNSRATNKQEQANPFRGLYRTMRGPNCDAPVQVRYGELNARDAVCENPGYLADQNVAIEYRWAER